MNIIYFSHNYEKFNQLGAILHKSNVLLLEVFKANFNELSDVFKRYDSIIYSVNRVDKKYYDFDKMNECIVLLFWQQGQLFTSIRNYTDNQYKYFLSLRGQKFQIIINEKQPK